MTTVAFPACCWRGLTGCPRQALNLPEARRRRVVFTGSGSTLSRGLAESHQEDAPRQSRSGSITDHGVADFRPRESPFARRL